mgnify:CR=1 FL=1
MATCKDCLHFEACKNIFELALRQTLPDQPFDKAERCKNFKDKGKYAEVVNGRWAIINDYCCVCSVCHKASTQTYYYCPECGAKMDGDGNG